MKAIFKADNVPIDWEQVDVTGVETGDKHSEELFRESIASLKRNRLGLKGQSFFKEASTSLLMSHQVFCTLRSNAQAINLSMSPYDKSLISMHRLS